MVSAREAKHSEMSKVLNQKFSSLLFQACDPAWSQHTAVFGFWILIILGAWESVYVMSNYWARHFIRFWCVWNASPTTNSLMTSCTMLGRSKRSSFLFPTTKTPIVEEERGMLSERKNERLPFLALHYLILTSIKKFVTLLVMCNTPSLMYLRMLYTVY